MYDVFICLRISKSALKTIDLQLINELPRSNWIYVSKRQTQKMEFRLPTSLLTSLTFSTLYRYGMYTYVQLPKEVRALR